MSKTAGHTATDEAVIAARTMFPPVKEDAVGHWCLDIALGESLIGLDSWPSKVSAEETRTKLVSQASAVIRKAYEPLVNSHASNLRKVEVLRDALRDAAANLEGIRNLIQEQVDEKIRGERSNYNWSAIITTINDQAEAGFHAVAGALALAEEQL